MTGFADLMAPVGPVAERFIGDQRFITAIMGPYGSAKTTSCIRKIVTSVFWQSPGPDGIRRARWCVVRDTYQQLETNVLNSWFTWFPKDKDNWNGREMAHRLRFDVVLLDGSPPQTIELEMYFRAMGDQKAEQVLKGLELTGLWLNEVDTLDRTVLRFGMPRTGRYPPAKLGGCQWSGVIADFNAPDIDNWTYDLLVDQNLPVDPDTAAAMKQEIGPRFGIGFHRQPGGRSADPEPENLRNLEKGYYSKIMLGMTPADVRRFVDNEFGAVRNGQPVYPEYNDDFHCASEPLRPQPGVPVCGGLDGGATPALVAGQRMDNGQIRTLGELVVFAADEDSVLEKLGPVQFGEMAGEWWAERFGAVPMGPIWADPAAWNGENADFSWPTEFRKGFIKGYRRVASTVPDVKLKPAPVKGNRITPRLEAVRHGLIHNIGNQPGQLISPDCRRLRRGFNNGYVINRIQLSNGSGRWKDEPDKNDFSHVHDAKQYLDLGLTRRGDALLAEEMGVRRQRERKGRDTVSFGDGFFAHRPGSGGGGRGRRMGGR